MHDKLLEACQHRRDEWSIEVFGRLESCNDIVAEEAMYHRQCYSSFITGCCNLRNSTSPEQLGRVVDDTKLEVFEALCIWLENSTELHFISNSILSWLGSLATVLTSTPKKTCSVCCCNGIKET